MPFLQLPDFKMHYEQRGSGEQILLLIHGNVASTQWWEALYDYVPADIHTVSMDLRGCGKSEHPTSGYTIAQFAEDIDQLAQHLHLDQFHILGHSMGGLIAQYYALKYPERVLSITLLDSVPANGLELDDEKRALFSLLATDRTVLRQAIDSCMQYAVNHTFVEAAFENAARCAINIYRDNPETMHATSLIDQVGQIAIPILIVHGKEDLIIPLDKMQATIQALPTAKVCIIDQCGHSPQIERTEKFAKVLIEFLDACTKQELN